jgi:hypothetical protein
VMVRGGRLFPIRNSHPCSSLECFMALGKYGGLSATPNDEAVWLRSR